MGYTRGCEPLRVWNRLEPRPRRADFSRALRTEIHDPLWMLGRQWQFGEFKGEDTGSPVYAKLAVRSAPITTFHNQAGAQALHEGVPLEARVEREATWQDTGARLRAGRLWLRMLHHHGNEARPGAYDAAAAQARSVAAFGFQRVTAAGATPEDVLARAEQSANPRLAQHLSALEKRAVDGLALAQALPTGDITWQNLPAGLKPGVHALEQDAVVKAAKAFRAALARATSEPDGAADRSWNDAQVEYQFACSVPRQHGGSLTLQADEYTQGRLDWYSFELGAEAVPQAPTPADARIHTEVLTVIPTPAEFPGQPNARLWELEDGAVDLGNVRADSTDLAKMLVAEFALVYGNNWFVIPCPQRVGTLAEVLGIVVQDVFGQRSLVRSATRHADPAWTRWDMFSLERRAGPVDAATLGAHLFLPPVLHGSQESDAIEAVRLVRDEISNTVWAVEARLSDGLGGSRDGNDVARRFAEAWQREEPPVPPSEAPPDVKLKYMLGNSVPENWIPFVPVHQPGSDRQVRLQRASMPRFFQNTVLPVRPRTRMLRVGLTPAEAQLSPFFLNEEEVPRAGLQVESHYQRARWHTGETVVWYARRVRSGRGEGSSGLCFDVIGDAE